MLVYLATKLIARESQNPESLAVVVLLVKLSQLLVVCGSESTLGGNIHNDANMTPKRREYFISLNGGNKIHYFSKNKLFLSSRRLVLNILEPNYKYIPSHVLVFFKGDVVALDILHSEIVNRGGILVVLCGRLNDNF